MNNFVKHLVWLLVIFADPAIAQDDGGGESKNPHQAGAFVGRVLPNGVGGEDEIFALGGVRYSYPMKGGGGYYDFGIMGGNGGGVGWQSAFASISMHIPIETLIGHAGVGMDMTRYSINDGSAKTAGGGHFIGGIMSEIGRGVHTRFDMKLTTKPGTTLFFGVGLVFDLGGSTENSGQ